MNMKKRILSLIIMIILMNIVSCGSVNSNAAAESTPASQSTSASQSSYADAVLQLNQFQNMSAIRYAGAEELAVLADKLYLYDLSVNAIKAETQKQDGWDADIGFYPVEGGYVVVGTNAAFEIECTFYDENLKRQSSLNIFRELELEPIFVREVAVSASGKLIAFSDIAGGLYLYSLEEKKLSNILTLEQPEVVCFLSNIAFSDQDKKIVFLGGKMNASGSNECIVGSIDLDGGNLHTAKGRDLSKMTAYSSFAIFGQEIPDEEPSGVALVYTLNTQELNQISLTEAEESTNIWGSQSGDYIGTTVCVEGKGWMIRVYETAGGTKVYEKLYACDTNLYRAPYLYIPDNADTLLLHLRSLEDNLIDKVEVFSISVSKAFIGFIKKIEVI